ncbi:MAG: DUF2817 domain-containing protein [Oligoflexia bacterium]|nr:DUF2817 domain-containing protein [Oligoflexia bacterium]
MILLLILLPFIQSFTSLAEENKTPSLESFCYEELNKLPGKHKDDSLRAACKEVKVLEGCESEKGVRIYHFDKAAKEGVEGSRKVLVFSLVHGDEIPSGSVARAWMERLTTIEPRNSWRVVPILNPDGLAKKTRMNGNGVDINRNFPTEDWDNLALKYWNEKTKKDPRRFPGKSAASEKETVCAIKHIEDFNPDLILSIHTPYGVLDFDGPRIPPPRAFPKLPWKSLGNYPGSLGRYMWVDRSKPTLTVELHGNHVADKLEQFDKLQDITGDIVIQTEKILNEKKEEETSKKNSKK